VTVAVTVDSQWDGGACSTAVVTNGGAQKGSWQVELDVGGKLSDVWNATATAKGSKTSFVGVSWNASLAPGGSASFGFCVQK
jgi:endoglucanase